MFRLYSDNSAQFSPFSALTGYEAVLREAGRLTDNRAEKGENWAALSMADMGGCFRETGWGR